MKQLYAKKVFTEGASTYQDSAVTKSGRKIKLVVGLETQEQATFIEQKIEKYLKSFSA